MLPETTEVVVRETLPKCPQEMAQDPVGAQDGHLQTFSTHNMTALAFTDSGASAQGEALPSPHPLENTLPQQTAVSQQTKEGSSSMSQEHSLPKQRMDVQEEYRNNFFRSLGLKQKGSADPSMVDASHNEQSVVLSSAESGSVEQTKDGDVDMVALSPEENLVHPVTLQAASPTVSRISTGGRRRTLSLSNCKLVIENHQVREEGLPHEGEYGNAMREEDVIIIEDSEEEVNERVASPVPMNGGLEVAKEKPKKDDGKTKSDEDRLKGFLRKIPISSPLFSVPLLKPLHHITTTADNNIIRSYGEYCKSNSGEKLRIRNFPTSWKRTEPSWCHKYKFNKADRQEFRRVLATGLTKRSRALLRNCKKCSVALKTLTTEDINRWKTRVVRKEIHYDDDLIMYVEEVITPSSTSEMNPVQSQAALSNHLAGSTLQPTPCLQRPPPSIRKQGCQVVRSLSGQISDLRAPGPRPARYLFDRNARKVVMKPKEVEKTFKGKEAGGIVRKTVYTPCQGEVSDPIRNRGSHNPNTLLPGRSTPLRTPPLAPKKSLAPLCPKPFTSIPNTTFHFFPHPQPISQPQPNSQPNCSSQQHPMSLLLPFGQPFEDRSKGLQSTAYGDPQHRNRTENEIDRMLEDYKIIRHDNQVADVTQMQHADGSIVYLQANPDGAMQCVNMPVSTVPFPSAVPILPLSFPNVGLTGEPAGMGSGVYGVSTFALAPTSEMGDFNQNLDRQEASDGQVVSTTLPLETSINLDSDEDVIVISDDESN